MSIVSTRGDVIYTLTVPCVPDSLAVLEGLCETFIADDAHLSSDGELILRLSVVEACRNALAQRRPDQSFSVTTLRFLRLGEDDARIDNIALEVADPGCGFLIDGAFPPYPDGHVGREFLLQSAVGWEVHGIVKDPLTVQLGCRQAGPGEGDSREAVLANIDDQEPPMGLLAIARCWETAEYSHRPGLGTVLRLQFPRSGA